jgi:hypothetical protein
MKINVDAALAKSLGSVVAAAVARDFTGRFLGASTVVMEGSLESETMEAIACKEGQALASDLLLQDFRLACDKEVWTLTGMLSRKLELDQVSLDLLSLSMKGDNQMWMLII